jgi:hypothetical protein
MEPERFQTQPFQGWSVNLLADAVGSAALGPLVLTRNSGTDSRSAQAIDQRYSLRNSQSSSPVSASAFAGRMEASRSSMCSLERGGNLSHVDANAPRNSPSALPKVQL